VARSLRGAGLSPLIEVDPTCQSPQSRPVGAALGALGTSRWDCALPPFCVTGGRTAHQGGVVLRGGCGSTRPRRSTLHLRAVEGLRPMPHVLFQLPMPEPAVPTAANRFRC
jgi:hypothetical protein